jgi:NADH:ubiquinone oxidoreductase subunit 6 (subunit J)
MGESMILGAGTEDSLAVDIIFWVIAVSAIVAAIAVVQLKDIFRAALMLIVTFMAVAGMFVLLRAEFLAVVQVLIYVGAISVLIIFAILMTGDVEEGNPYNRLKIPAAVLSALFLATVGFVIYNTGWHVIDVTELAELPGVVEVFDNTVPEIGRLLIREYVLAFEVASVVLLAAIIGALALIRER